MTPALIGLLALLLAPGAHAAGFDCAKAATPVERMICADAGLSRLDEELAAAYNTAKARNPNGLKEAQVKWLKEVRNPCTTPACLTAAYRQRLEALGQAGPPSPFPAVYLGGFVGDERLEFTADGRIMEEGRVTGNVRPDIASPWRDALYPLLLTRTVEGQEEVRHCKIQPDLAKLICDDGGTLAAEYARQGPLPAVALTTASRCDEEQLYLDVMAAAREAVPGLDLKGATGFDRDEQGRCIISLYFLDNGQAVDLRARYDMKERPVRLTLLDQPPGKPAR